MPRKTSGVSILLGVCWALGAACSVGTDVARAQAIEGGDVGASTSEVEQGNMWRMRGSGVLYRFRIDTLSFMVSGPEVGIDRLMGERWIATASYGQAYGGGGGVGPLLTSMDFGVGYSLTGNFTRAIRTYRDAGVAVVRYRARATGGLRLGLGVQQYSFNSPTGTVPFSGVAARVMYELGWASGYDVAVGAEAAQLGNSAVGASAQRGFIQFLWPF